MKLQQTNKLQKKYKKNRKCEFAKGLICHLTCITVFSTPSMFTCEASSTLYVTRVVFTVRGTGSVTVTAVETSILTSCIKWRYITQYSEIIDID